MHEASEGLMDYESLPVGSELGLIRLTKGVEKFDVYDTGDNLGILEHPDKGTTNELRRFVPQLLDGMLHLEQDVFKQLQALEDPQVGVNNSDREAASEEFVAFQKLVSALSRVAYYPKNSGEGASPKEAARNRATAQWFFKRYDHNFSAEPEILAYPQKGPQPRRISPHNYDFRDPAVMQLTVTDQHSKERLSIEVFPTASYQYPGKFSSLGTVPPEQARQVLADRRVNPEIIRDVIAAGEASAIKPHVRLRLEGSHGRPISQAIGSLMRNREGTALGLYLQYQGPENSKLEDMTSAMQKRKELFVPLPGFQKVQNAPLASFGQAILGLQLKERMDVANIGKSAARKGLAMAGRRSA